MYKKSVMHVQSCCFAYKTYCFLMFSSPSASLILKSLIGSLGNGNENGKKAASLDKQDKYFARASRYFVHFFAVTAHYDVKLPNQVHVLWRT